MSKKALVAIIIVLVTSKSYAHENKTVHPFVLTSRAFDMFHKTGSNAYYHEEFKYYFNSSPSDYNNLPIALKGTLGTIEEDVPSTQTVYHFYNPVTGKGGAGGIPSENAIVYGKDVWNAAIWKYKQGDKEDAYYKLGRVLHLLQDLSTPEHVYNDSHIGEARGYEAWVKVKDNIPLLLTAEEVKQPSGSTYGGFDLNYDDFLYKVADKTYHSAKIQGKLYRDKDSPAIGDLTSLFPSLSYLEYVDPDIFDWNGYWKIANVGTYECAHLLTSDSWWLIKELPFTKGETNEGVKYVDGYFYIEKTKDVIPARCWDKQANLWVDNNYGTRNFTLAHLWAGVDGYRATPNQQEQLVPISIGYTAGLMKLFYDSKDTIYPKIVGTLKGRITDSLTHEGISNAEVTVSSESGEIETSTITDSNGNYSLTLPEGTYSMCVHHPECASQYLFNIAVTAGSEITRGISLERWGMFIGKVVRERDDAPIENALVEAVTATESTRYSGTTDSGGNYEVRVPPGTWNLHFSARGYKLVELINNAISWGETVTLNVKLQEAPPQITAVLVPSPQETYHTIYVSAAIEVALYKSIERAWLVHRRQGNIWTWQGMTPARNDFYVAEIEAQRTPGVVEYYFEAIDNNGLIGRSPEGAPGKVHSFEVIDDKTPPRVEMTLPENRATGISLNVEVIVTFSEEVNKETLNGGTVKLRDANGNETEISSSYETYAKRKGILKFKPKVPLASLSTYYCEITSGVRDLAGNPLQQPYSWWFTTKEVLPPVITGVSPTTPENFLASTEKMVFSCKFNKPVSEVKIVLKNTSTEEEFTITDSTPILTSSREDNRYSYIYAWNGIDDQGKYLPDGEYKFRIEATDAKYGVVGSSEFQPFEFDAAANGTIYYKQKAYYIPGTDLKQECSPNYDQTVEVIYKYRGDPLGKKIRFYINGEEKKLGGDHVRCFGGSGQAWFSVPADAKCSWGGGSTGGLFAFVLVIIGGIFLGFVGLYSWAFLTPLLGKSLGGLLTALITGWVGTPMGNEIASFVEGIQKQLEGVYAESPEAAVVTYKMIRIDPEEYYLWHYEGKQNYAYQSPSHFRGLKKVKKGEYCSAEFEILLVPRKISMKEPEFWSIETPRVENVHLVRPPPSKDYDDNPEVETRVDAVGSFEVPDGGVLAGVLRARNISPPISPFIFDRTPPEIDVYVSSSTFSPILNQEVDITFTVTDNLLFPLADVSLKIYDSNNNLVQTLYDKSSDSPATRTFTWDGKGSDAYNGGQIVSDRAYTYVVQAKDGAGNPNSFSDTIIVDTTPPEICDGSLLIIPANHPHPETFTTNDDAIQMAFSLSDNLSGSVNVEMVIESTSLGPLVTRQKAYTVTTALQSIREEWDGKDDQGNYLPDGTYKITLIATDLAGNTSEPLVLPMFSIDRTPSRATTLYVDNFIFTPDDGPNNQGDSYQDSATLHYILSEEALVSVRVEDVLGRAILSLSEASDFRTEGAHLWDGKVNGSFVSDGSYIFRIKTTDDVGNIAYDNIAVIKNQIPAQIVFPSKDTVPAKVSGLVSIKGIALDPGINNPADFEWYKVWYREGKDIDFGLSENDPLYPDVDSWRPVAVPPYNQYNQNTLDPKYPNSNVSWRAVAYTTLATWDTTGLTPGSYYTLLLVTEDEEGNSSYDFVTIEVDPTIDNTSPQITITYPSELSEFRIVSDTSTLSIVYDLVQNNGKQADVSLVIFRMSDDGANYGPIVYHRDYLSRSEGGTIFWDGKDNLRRYVENGRYRIQLAALDRDGLGGSVAQVDITCKVIVTEPLKIVKFAASNSVVNVGGSVEISCELSKEASVTVTIYDASDNLVETLVDSLVTPGEVEQKLTWTSQLEGLYTCRIDAIATDAEKTKDEASLSFAVTDAGAGTGIGEITYPADGSIVQGFSNFSWVAAAQGEHYPPQLFVATVQAHGYQSWMETDWSRGSYTLAKDVDTVSSPGEIRLASYKWLQTTDADFNAGIKEIVEVMNNNVYLARTPTYNLNKRAMTMRIWEHFISVGNGTACIWEDISGSSVVVGDNDLCPKLTVTWDKPYLVNKLLYNFDVSTHGNPDWFYARLYRGGSIVYEYSCDIPDQEGYRTGDVTKIFDPVWADKAVFEFTIKSETDVKFWIYKLYYYEVPYYRRGNIVSKLLDTGNDNPVWGNFEATVAGVDSSNYIQFYTQVSGDGSNWDNWVRAYPGNKISSASKRFIRWKADFYGDGIRTPVLADVTINWRPPNGYLVSLPHDCGDKPTSWGKFEVWESKPGGTAIEYYTQGSDNNIDWGQEVRVDQGLIQSDLKPYIRWRASLSTNDGLSTPVLKQVNLSAHWEPIRPIATHCWFGHPYYSPDLASLFPISGGFARISPFYSIVSHSNLQVTKSITDENGYYQLKAMTDVKEDWNTTEDQGLSDGRIVSINNEFNNSLNPEDFIIESSLITISTGYPNVNMWVADEVKNKYTFWWNPEGSLIDNPYVSVNTESWDIRLLYPDGTKNIDLIVNKQADKSSNTNTTALDDDFAVKLSSNAAPKVFVELKGNTSTLAQGFKGYSLFYKKPDETTWKSIPSASKLPVINSEMLGWWDVTGLNGEYVVRMVVLDDSGSNELTKNMIIGTKVPGAEATASPPNYVTSPYNKAFLSFPPDALEKDIIVTITPVRLEDTGVSIDPHMPEPIGAFYKLQPKDISFSKDSAGNVLYPASFSVRFTYEELQGIDPGHLTIYHVKDDGSLESLDVKVVYDENGNGLFDLGEIATVTSPITSFSYYLVIPMILAPTLDQIRSPTNQKSVTVTGQAQDASSVEVFINGASVGNVDVNEDGKFSMPVSLVTGSNRITCIGTGWFNDIKRTSKPSAPIEVVLDMTPPEITDVYDSPDPFTPNGDGIRDNTKILYTLSEESLVELKIYKEESLVRTLIDSSKMVSGPHSKVWDGRDDGGSMVEEGIYTYKIDARDLAGNATPQQEGQLEVSYQTMAPPAPILLAPPDEEYIDSTTPTFQISPDETVERQLIYSIEISTDDFRTVFKRYDQTVSTEGWTLEGEIIQYAISQEDALGDAIYRWRAFSYDDVQWSESSIVWTFKLDMEPPPKPKLLSPEDGASVNSPKPTFDWEDVVDAVSGLDCYEIRVDNNGDFGSPEYIAMVTASQFIPQSDLAQGEYYWRVRARDKLDHYSDWTDPWRFKRANSPSDGPTLMSPENGKFIITEFPTFQLFCTDPDNDPLKCKVELSTDNFNTIERSYDQNISTTGWKVVEVPSSPQGIIAQYTIQPGDELAEGIYYWRACVYDGTLWSDNSAIWNFTLDMSSATISVASPVKGEVYNARQRMIEIEFTVADLDPNPTINAYLQNGDNIRIIVSSGETIEPLDIEDGLWNLIVESTDWAGNVSSMVAGPFEVTHDIRPPRTSIVVGEPNYGQDPVYITSDTQFTLTSVDDYFTIGDGKGLGLSLTEYSIDGNDWTTYTGTFTVTLGEAPHTIYYRSIDKGGLREETKSQDIVIDNKVPQIILIAEGNLSTNGIDNFASLSCQYRLAVIGDSSWVDHTEFKVDGTEWKTYTASFGFDAAGEHIIKYRIVSKTGNPEKENVFEVIVDNTLPVTTLNSSPPLYNGLYASTSTIYSISGIDTLVDGKASGMAEIKYRIDEEEFKTYFQNFVLTGGQHTIHYYGRDNVNNVEKPNPFNVVVDTVPPQTTLTPSESLYEDGENIFASISCMYSLKSFQNLSGVNRIEFSIDNGDWQIYKSSISFLTEGIHAIKYKAVSNTGVWEEEKRFSFIIDVKGPKIASVYPENGAYVRAPDLTAIRICFAEPVKIGDDKWENGVSISETKSGALVRGNIRYDDIEYAVTFSTRFEDHTPYNIKLTSEIRDKVGNPLKEFASSFTTLMLKEKGGKVEEGEVWLDIPPNALPQDAVIIINKEQDEIVNKIPRPLQSFEKDTLYHIVAYNQDHQEIQQKLKKPMEMKISYGKLINSQVKDSSKGEGNSIDPKTLKLYWYNAQKERWELVENSKNDFSVKQVMAQVETFGRYCLMGFVPFGDSLEGLSNYPNPFPAFGKDYTTIQYYLKDDADVAIAIYDLMGNLVKVFEKKKGEEGGRGGDLNRVEWDGRNGRGDKVANGGYICRIQIDDGKRVKSKTRKILVIK